MRSLQPSEKAIISASVVEQATVSWRLLMAKTTQPLRQMHQPDILRPVSGQLAYEASTYMLRRSAPWSPPTPFCSTRVCEAVPFRYLATRFRQSKCSALCLALKRPRTLSAVLISGRAERA